MTAAASTVTITDAAPLAMSDSTEKCLDSSDPADVRQWLEQHSHRKQLAVLDSFLKELRLQRLTQSSSPSDDDEDDDDTQNNNSNTTPKPLPKVRWNRVHKTLNLLRHMIGSTAWKTPAELLCVLRGLGAELSAAAGRQEPATANLVRRVMAAVREEAHREAQEADTAQDGPLSSTNASTQQGGRLTLTSMLWALPQHVRPSSRRVHNVSGVETSTASVQHQRQESIASEADVVDGGATYPASYYVPRPNLKAAVLEAIQEIMTDLEDLHRNMNEHVTSHVHAGEVILTCGASETIQLFLLAAHHKIQQQNQQNHQQPSFSVIVCGPRGRTMARQLVAHGLTDVTWVETATIPTLLPRVHTVLLPAHAVLANGGVVAPSGCHLVALAAAHASVPVVCVTGLYKLCPVYPHDGQDTLQDWTSPVPDVVPEYGELAESGVWQRRDDGSSGVVEMVNPRHDYVEPKYVSLYITNVGTFQPSFIYRLLAENYHTDDWDSFL